MTEDSRHGTSMGVVCAHTKPPKHLNLVVDRKSKNRSRRDQKTVAPGIPRWVGVEDPAHAGDNTRGKGTTEITKGT